MCAGYEEYRCVMQPLPSKLKKWRGGEMASVIAMGGKMQATYL